MLCVNNNNNISFRSVVPVRVFIDGMETRDSKLIKSACHKLSYVLAGPPNSKSDEIIIRKFAQHDPDYMLHFALNGYPKDKSQKALHASDYFRFILKDGKTYLFTGAQAEQLKILGKSIGKEKSIGKTYKNNSFDLFVSQKNYFNAISDFIKASRLRLKKTFDIYTHERIGQPVTLHLQLSSNKKYGRSAFKTEVESISME